MTALENLRVGKSGVIARGIISGVVETDANFLNGGASGTVQHLILSGYLYQTSDEHPVVRLGERANEILRNGESVHMKLSKEKEPERDKNDRETKKVKILTAQETQTSVRPVDRRLFESLKKLRLNIANEQCVPAFSVFSDSTLPICVLNFRLQTKNF